MGSTDSPGLYSGMSASPVVSKPPQLTATKLKSVTFPENTLITVWPESPSFDSSVEQLGSEPNSPNDPNIGCSSYRAVERSLDISDNGSLNQCESLNNISTDPENQSGVLKSDSYDQSIIRVDSSGNDSPIILDSLIWPTESPNTYFSNLRKEQVERADSLEEDSQSEWKTLDSYFAQEEEFKTLKDHEPLYGHTLKPPNDLVDISSSTERRYSAVVQQFMLKNGLLTPHSEGAMLSRQADQARASEPSYVSWSSVDHNPDNDSETPVEPKTFQTFTGVAPTATPEIYTPGNVIPRSGESFKLHSRFTPNKMSQDTPEPMSTLAEVDDSGSLNNTPVLSRQTSAAVPHESAFSPSRFPARVHSNAPSTGRRSVAPFSTRRRQVLNISTECGVDDNRREKYRKIGYGLITVGLIVMICSIIALIVQLHKY